MKSERQGVKAADGGGTKRVNSKFRTFRRILNCNGTPYEEKRKKWQPEHPLKNWKRKVRRYKTGKVRARGNVGRLRRNPGSANSSGSRDADGSGWRYRSSRG
ncbi:hypothetical protein QLX08_005128 [Tetragonisca angustula]|uniref:Uncharacterized protein n=1 Tax=Tetragonisca angustula TaxID=166442 RepID=A0AAW0ZZQ9_9HYME